MGQVTREAVIEAAKRPTAEAHGPLAPVDFERLTGIRQFHVYRLNKTKGSELFPDC